MWYSNKRKSCRNARSKTHFRHYLNKIKVYKLKIFSLPRKFHFWKIFFEKNICENCWELYPHAPFEILSIYHENAKSILIFCTSTTLHFSLAKMLSSSGILLTIVKAKKCWCFASFKLSLHFEFKPQKVFFQQTKHRISCTKRVMGNLLSLQKNETICFHF